MHSILVCSLSPSLPLQTLWIRPKRAKSTRQMGSSRRDQAPTPGAWTRSCKSSLQLCHLLVPHIKAVPLDAVGPGRGKRPACHEPSHATLAAANVPWLPYLLANLQWYSVVKGECALAPWFINTVPASERVSDERPRRKAGQGRWREAVSYLGCLYLGR